MTLTAGGIDYASVCRLPWPHALQLRDAVQRDRRARLAEHAAACRAAQLDADDWARWLDSLENDRA